MLANQGAHVRPFNADPDAFRAFLSGHARRNTHETQDVARDGPGDLSLARPEG
jgi:hypothetical protein